MFVSVWCELNGVSAFYCVSPSRFDTLGWFCFGCAGCFALVVSQTKSRPTRKLLANRTRQDLFPSLRFVDLISVNGWDGKMMMTWLPLLLSVAYSWMERLHVCHLF
ncbi:hypothetical protein P175DRAFT_0500317 [Aspergillus ochraceoroseus IBT 24754]|uniref:Uncharacterized protein n=1 Tax=Aspergillus ochraceoroseus IBT 24754 TaxID=1392256 RepID=A0A2T5LYR2_9EURO|nr:uncharacterized protein P175DRAFT_0500317 [Aspergillus ochraceoroseus IBT 24754]PTU21416.1 hypothetical protein P175DRAFT_0500317 [Aspergillus ochraceoroseus IBT 24754]